jgi:hypothetical protein
MASPKDFKGISFKPIKFPEWKHKLIKFFAAFLFIKKVKYVILIHDFETKEKNGRTRPRAAKPRVSSNASRRTDTGSKK